ncbi:uncharacterized protein [Venturia canescens]|uniref:uncharacterized protein n=1 Tax=Venturia canescens TaxID=32260 RepID=UPI001C9D0BF3|nr:uncharacterized protein LOC122416315 [Venturia canescens]
MNISIFLVIFGLWAARAQENSLANVPKSLLECYNNTYLLNRNNKLPQNVPALLAILRKIEDTPGLNMDLRALSVALLHRFRQDGIIENPWVPQQEGVTPYAPNGYQFYRQAETLKLIPGNAMSFPNESITSVERCSLHSMLSSSIDIMERGDEPVTCRTESLPYRRLRNVRRRSPSQSRGLDEDVETLTAEEIETMSNKDETKDSGVDPNSWYPPLPPNHPNSARLSTLPPKSKCPVENGVLKSNWGAIAGGSVLAGIAAGLEPQNVTLAMLLREEWQSHNLVSNTILENKWIATVAGDLAEVALRQGPLADGKLTLGVDGHWNSTYLPRWYFLNSNEDLFYTAAEIRGDLDGLILAYEISKWYSLVPSLRLSQIIDMYYSDRGVFGSSIKACNRRNTFLSIVPNATITSQAFRSALVLSSGVAKVTIDPATIEKFAVQASEKLFSFLPGMKDVNCEGNDTVKQFNRVSTNLTIFLDPNWPFTTIQPLLAALLEGLEVSKYDSEFTIMSAANGSVMINNTDSILDFYEFNETRYSAYRGKFDLSKTFDVIKSMQASQLDDEQRRSIGGGSSEVILIVPYTSTVTDENKEYCKEQLKIMYEDIPDATLMFLTSGSRDSWSDLVRDPNDIVYVGTVSTAQDVSAPINSLLTSIKRVPQRLVNSQCGSTYSPSGSSGSFDDYLDPSGIKFYRLHPNYFYRNDPEVYATVKVTGSSSTSLIVCTSRDPLAMDVQSSDCKTVNSDTQSVTFGCGDAGFIHKCNSVYLSIMANPSNISAFQCLDQRYCRYPDVQKFTISYDNLLCANAANSIIISPIIFVLFIISSYL